MDGRTPEYASCEECGDIVPDGGHIHSARKRTRFDTAFGQYLSEARMLCCKCIVTVGGSCDE